MRNNKSIGAGWKRHRKHVHFSRRAGPDSFGLRGDDIGQGPGGLIHSPDEGIELKTTSLAGGRAAALIHGIDRFYLGAQQRIAFRRRESGKDRRRSHYNSQ